MKILILGHASSIHTLKWVRSIAECGISIRVLSLTDPSPGAFVGMPGVSLKVFRQDVRKGKPTFRKLSYLRVLGDIRREVRDFRPDVLHAHYASSYGLLGVLSGFHPLVISVWGSDVYDFPKISIFHALILRFILSRAARILSTSRAMAEEARLYTSRPIEITPFGIDLRRFRPDAPKRDVFPGQFVVGTIKALEEVYGQEYLLKAFQIAASLNPKVPLRLWIVGSGSSESRLRSMAEELGLVDRIRFEGSVPNACIQECHARMDIFVMLSNAESFGVAALEAQACGKPVVATNVGGIPEVVEDGVTGFLVHPRDPEAAARAISRLIQDPELRERMGRAGRTRVETMYDGNRHGHGRLRIYESLINKRMEYSGDKES